jgi:galactoside O-acetyltransferase
VRRWVERVVGLPGWVALRVRRAWFARRFASLGPGASLGADLHVISPGRIRIGSGFSCWRQCTLAACDDGAIEVGDRVSLNSNVYLNACKGGRIVLGNDVLIGPNVVLRTSDHAFADPDRPIRTQGHIGGEIVIEDDVWIASNVTVVGGVRIGHGAVVAGGAAVVSDVEPMTVVGGVPARVLKRRGVQSAEAGF